MDTLRCWAVKRAVLGALIVLAVTMVAPAAGQQGADGDQAENAVVFYSGFGEAGIDFAAPIVTHEFVHTRESNEWESYTASTTCGTHKADDFEPGSANVLVSWSIGRVAPIYFLAQSRNRWDEIDTIWLLDPGSEAKMIESPENGNCDNHLPELPAEYLREWLLEAPSRRLMILSGNLTQSDDRAGLERFYLAGFDTPRLYAQTHLCVIDSGEVSNHDNRLVEFFVPFTAGSPVCPDRSNRILLPGQPPDPGSIGEQIAGSAWQGASDRAGLLVRLYGSVFDRLPDEAGINFWLVDGRNPFDLARFFVTADEFTATYGTLSDEEFIAAIYDNVLDRDPDKSGQAYWQNRLATDLDRASMVLLFSDSPEFRAVTQTS